MNTRYEGISGNTQGAKNDSTPELKATIPFNSKMG